MQINSFSNIQNLLLNKDTNIQSNTIINNNVSYKADTLNVGTYQTDPIIPKEPYEPPVPSEPKFFDKPMVRLTGMSLALGVVGGGIGAGISRLVGAATLTRGIAIGATVGFLTPAALLAYGLYTWNRNNK